MPSTLVQCKTRITTGSTQQHHHHFDHRRPHATSSPPPSPHQKAYPCASTFSEYLRCKSICQLASSRLPFQPRTPVESEHALPLTQCEHKICALLTFPQPGHLTSSDTSLSALPVNCLFRVREWVCFFFGTARSTDSQISPSSDGIRSGSNERIAAGENGKARLGRGWRALVLGWVRRKGRGRMNLGRTRRHWMGMDVCREAIDGR